MYTSSLRFEQTLLTLNIKRFHQWALCGLPVFLTSITRKPDMTNVNKERTVCLPATRGNNVVTYCDTGEGVYDVLK